MFLILIFIRIPFIRCFIDHESTLVLLHSPLAMLAIFNLLMFFILVTKLFSARQNAAAR